jgi:hypothetical protein
VLACPGVGVPFFGVPFFGVPWCWRALVLACLHVGVPWCWRAIFRRAFFSIPLFILYLNEIKVFDIDARFRNSSHSLLGLNFI